MEVGSGSIIDDGRELHEAFKEHPRIAALPVLDVFNAATDSLLAFDNFVDTISTPPIPFDTKKWVSDMIENAKQLGKGMDAAEKYRKGLYGVKKESLKSESEKKRKTRTGRDAVKKTLTGKSVSEVVAKRVADGVQGFRDRREVAYAKAPFTSATYASPFMIPAPSGDDTKDNFLTKAIATIATDNESNITKAHDLLQAGCEEKELKQGVRTFSLKTPFDFQTSPDDYKPGVIALGKGFAGLMRDCNFYIRKKAQPYQSMGHILTPTKGNIVATLLPPAVLLEHSDLVTWLQSMGPKALDKMEVYVVKEKSSLFIPFGYVALPVGILDLGDAEAPATTAPTESTPDAKKSGTPKKTQPQQKKVDPDTEWLKYMSFMVLDPVADAKRTPELCNAVMSVWSGTGSFMPEYFLKLLAAEPWVKAVQDRGKECNEAEAAA